MKQIRRMSHFETFLIALVLITGSLPAHSRVKCETYFKPTLVQNITDRLQSLNPTRFFQRKQNLQLTPLQAESLRQLTTAAEFKKPYGLGRDENSPLFVYMWQSLKPEMRETISLILDHAPIEQKKFRNHLDDIYKRYEIEFPSGNTFYDAVISAWADHVKFKNPDFIFSEWMSRIENNFENSIRSGVVNREKVRFQFEMAVKFREAQERWHSSYGVNAIEHRQIDQHRQVLKLKSGHELEAVISSDGKSIKIKVPREIVGRAAWNPIYTEVLQDKISKGTKPPEIYDGFLATNVVFYLTDGNHRFILDQREEVWIRMSYPARTASMSISFDAFGFSQPKVETLVELFEGKKTLEDLVGGANAARILYK